MEENDCHNSEIIGRDYYNIGLSGSIEYRIGNGEGYPFKGPIKIKLIDDNTSLAVIELEKGISFINLANRDSFFDGNGKVESIQGASLVDSAADAMNSNHSDSINFLNISAIDIVKIPLSPNFAVCDTSTNKVNFIDSKEWYQKKTLNGDYSRLSGILCLQVGREVQLFVCDTLQQTIFAVKEGGQLISSCCGDPNYNLNEPVSISLYTEVSIIPARFRDPSWFIGSPCSVEELMNELPETTVHPGEFFVAKDIEKKGVYNIVYVNSMCEKCSGTFTLRENGDVMLSAQDTETNTIIGRSIYDIVMKWDMLIKVIIQIETLL